MFTDKELAVLTAQVSRLEPKPATVDGLVSNPSTENLLKCWALLTSAQLKIIRINTAIKIWPHLSILPFSKAKVALLRGYKGGVQFIIARPMYKENSLALEARLFWELTRRPGARTGGRMAADLGNPISVLALQMWARALWSETNTTIELPKTTYYHVGLGRALDAPGIGAEGAFQDPPEGILTGRHPRTNIVPASHLRMAWRNW